MNNNNKLINKLLWRDSHLQKQLLTKIKKINPKKAQSIKKRLNPILKSFSLPILKKQAMNRCNSTGNWEIDLEQFRNNKSNNNNNRNSNNNNNNNKKSRNNNKKFRNNKSKRSCATNCRIL